jgi:ADP-heptose:LPS heptosyltransferase
LKLYLRPSRELAARRIKEGGPRIYDPRERVLLAAFDFFLRAGAPLFGLRARRADLPHPGAAGKVLALRLDRVGDLVMTLPALGELRRRLPRAEIVLAVGSWNADLAQGLPFVDRVLVVDLPSAAWGKRASWREALGRLRALGRPDLALDFQGDVRALLLMAATRAPLRAGYGDTGGEVLLNRFGRWDERTSWYRQNLALVSAVFPKTEIQATVEPYNFLLAADRERGEEILRRALPAGSPRPWIAIHPSAGRAIKQWEVEKLAALADRLREKTGGSVLLSGAESDRALVEAVGGRAGPGLPRLMGSSSLRGFAAALERLDLFVTGDTGPMHIAHSVGAPTLAVFGPSDPARYGPEGESARRRVVREPLYCSPCNMIRKPPRECTAPPAPPCLASVGVERVVAEALDLLRSPVRTGS